jgi:myosin heavy subunit
MKKRHIEGKPYTRTGDIVIAINPFQWFHNLYTEEKRNLYSNKLVWNDSNKDLRLELEPHVYELSVELINPFLFRVNLVLERRKR